MGEKVLGKVLPLFSPFAKYHNRKIVDESEEYFASVERRQRFCRRREGFLSLRNEGRRYSKRELE
ncbi:hypothetical protein A2714_02410 [Candidatus Woesebacteria bacterium RIFCSPHIGHO2_01_FULL_38_9]|uniref:Uncharacterized protein n=2 Tax=Candidatus Woeseibacteriota TaxID=1752722 RepID=A0A1F7XYU5_9BACT|nr:MAG: hypothetical protein A2714_02410 [Candidatus Woesebacteria bacterium RIFCSPHIGHO2_01_FULL_38_9]OGM59053.1 MAG: hypothetical protein A3A75_05285 [Candidatus Woesebacteria bacterium RIFCSPLOWO2_01_FULL_39_10]